MNTSSANSSLYCDSSHNSSRPVSAVFRPPATASAAAAPAPPAGASFFGASPCLAPF